MPVLGAVRRNPWLRTFYERLRAAGKPPKLALIAAMRKLLHAVYSVAKNRKPFVIRHRAGAGGVVPDQRSRPRLLGAQKHACST